MSENKNHPELPVTADQCVLAGGSAVAGLIANAAVHSNGSVALLVGGVAVAASFLLVPKELRLRQIKAFIPSFYAGDDADRESLRLERRAVSSLRDDDDGDELRPPTKMPSGLFTFSQVLKSGFAPTMEKIYLGQLEDGTSVFCAARDLCHVALAGSTGNGKSSIMRMLMAQLCYVGAHVLLLNPHFTKYDLTAEIPEDWTPFIPFLEYDPMECRSYDVIGYYLEYIATKMLPKRLDKYANSIPVGKPYFVVMDELPAIMDNVPNASKHLKSILQQGRKVGIYLISASQDFLVKTIDPSGKAGGAVRDCYKTVFYTGGDGTTGSVLLDTTAKAIPEDELGQGSVMLRSGKVLKKASKGRVPYTDNESLYAMVGPSTYVPARVVDEDDLPTTENLEPSVLDTFNQMYDQQRESDTEDPVPATRMAPLPMKQQVSAMPLLPSRVPETPVLPERSRLAEDLPMSAVIALWNANGGMSINELATTWDIKRNQAEKLRNKILASVQEAQQGTQIDEE